MGTLEYFNDKTSKVMQGTHGFAAPILTWEDVQRDADTDRACRSLNADATYQVTIEGKVRRCSFKKFHGVHAIFYSAYDNWNIAIFCGDIRKMVKRVKAKEHTCTPDWEKDHSDETCDACMGTE